MVIFTYKLQTEIQTQHQKENLSKNLHIVTLNIPYPPDYGGLIDTFYRIQSLHNLGVKIHLHCFEYGRRHAKELELLCETISYYPRKTDFLQQCSLLPYIISSRKSNDLLNNLIKKDFPILFDGLHSTYYINHPDLYNRRKFVRVHNIEHQYYNALAQNESNLIRKLYFHIESLKLKRYEKVIINADWILTISANDQKYFNNKYHNSVLSGPSHPFNESESLPGFGKYILFHGDLSVNENARVSDSLISGVFSKLSFPCKIAGKNPPEYLLSHASRYPNIQVISNPDNDAMKKLILNAHINLLPALAANGVKIKILYALFEGRHCLVNSLASESTSLSSLCYSVNSNEEIIDKINSLMQERFTEDMIIKRKNLLFENYNNLNNAKKLIELIFNG